MDLSVMMILLFVLLGGLCCAFCFFTMVSSRKIRIIGVGALAIGAIVFIGFFAGIQILSPTLSPSPIYVYGPAPSLPKDYAFSTDHIGPVRVALPSSTPGPARPSRVQSLEAKPWIVLTKNAPPEPLKPCDPTEAAPAKADILASHFVKLLKPLSSQKTLSKNSGVSIPPRPNWIDHPPADKNGTSYHVLETRPWSDWNTCERKLKDKLNWFFRSQAPRFDRSELATLRGLVQEETYYETIDSLRLGKTRKKYALVRFPPKAHQFIQHQQEHHLRHQNQKRLLLFFALGLGTLAVFYAGFWLDASTKGYYTMRIVAGTTSLLLVTYLLLLLG